MFSTCCKLHTLSDRMRFCPQFFCLSASERGKLIPMKRTKYFLLLFLLLLSLAHYTHIVPFLGTFVERVHRAEHFSISRGDLRLPDSSWRLKTPTRLKVSRARRTSFPLLFLIHGGNRVWHFITLSGPQTNVCSSLPHKKREREKEQGLMR